MKQKINSRFVTLSLVAVIVTTVCLTSIYYYIFQSQVKNDLRMNAELVEASNVFQKGKIPSFDLNVAGLRITWIDTDGTVLFDNENDVSQLENHLSRPEVQDALKKGYGETVRTSDTMKTNTFYYALRMKDTTVIRVATEAKSIWNVVITTFPLIVFVIVIITIACILLTHLLTIRLLGPINKVAEQISEEVVELTEINEYKELIPFMNTIRAQHENVLKAAKSRQDFTANVSHELKTPLTAISGYAEFIENGMADQEQQVKFAKEIRNNSERLLSLINDIIRLSEIDNSDKHIGFEHLDLSEIVRKCVDELQVYAKKEGIHLEYQGVSCNIYGNRFMLEELVENLCTNAIRYNNPGGYVHVTVIQKGSGVSLFVEDNGIGISKDQQESIFERFYRVDKSRSKQTGGTGLGLAIVKHIVLLHDATITVDSSLGKGTCMCVTF